VSGGSGTVAPRKRQAYASKRLQQIVSDFRTQQARLAGEPSEDNAPEDLGAEGEEPEQPAPKKQRRTAKKTSAGPPPTSKKAARGKGRSRGRGGSVRGGKRRAMGASDEDSLPEEDRPDDGEFVPTGGPSAQTSQLDSRAQRKPRPRPRPRPTRKPAPETSGEVEVSQDDA
jgi:DNA excision repair protein ERCC-5